MRRTDIQQLLDGGFPLRFPESDVGESAGMLVVLGQVALPVHPVRSFINADVDVPIVEPGGTEIARLLLTTRLPPSDVGQLTEQQYIAYLNDATPNQVGSDYRFRWDYVVLPIANHARYMAEYFAYAGLWGGFVHVATGQPIPHVSSTKLHEIRAHSGLHFPTSFHDDSLFRSSQVEFGFERYLKLYHLLELMFDWKVVDVIKSLGADLHGVGEILSRYTNKEITRLRWLLELLVKDTSGIVSVLNNLHRYGAIGKKIFFDFGKDGNPFATETELSNLQSQGGFGLGPYSAWRKKGTPDSHKKFVIETAAYCIYRLRCCIAHNRIGEYVMATRDEEFVVEFGEPLLRATLIEVFSH